MIDNKIFIINLEKMFTPHISLEDYINNNLTQKGWKFDRIEWDDGEIDEYYKNEDIEGSLDNEDVIKIYQRDITTFHIGNKLVDIPNDVASCCQFITLIVNELTNLKYRVIIPDLDAQLERYISKSIENKIELVENASDDIKDIIKKIAYDDIRNSIYNMMKLCSDNVYIGFTRHSNLHDNIVAESIMSSAFKIGRDAIHPSITIMLDDIPDSKRDYPQLMIKSKSTDRCKEIFEIMEYGFTVMIEFTDVDDKYNVISDIKFNEDTDVVVSHNMYLPRLKYEVDPRPMCEVEIDEVIAAFDAAVAKTATFNYSYRIKKELKELMPEIYTNLNIGVKFIPTDGCYMLKDLIDNFGLTKSLQFLGIDKSKDDTYDGIEAEYKINKRVAELIHQNSKENHIVTSIDLTEYWSFKDWHGLNYADDLVTTGLYPTADHISIVEFDYYEDEWYYNHIENDFDEAWDDEYGAIRSVRDIWDSGIKFVVMRLDWNN